MITFKDAKESDMTSVAKLHIECFQGTFISSLGLELIENYYLEYLKEKCPFVLAYSYEYNSLIGFCMGYYDGSKARESFLAHNKKQLIHRLLELCLSFNRLAISKCWHYVFPAKKPKKDKDKQPIKAEADLLSICVKETYRGIGVSKDLVRVFEKKLIENDKKDVTLSVYKTNDRAIGFYKKIGYSIVDETVDEYKMYKQLQ